MRRGGGSRGGGFSGGGFRGGGSRGFSSSSRRHFSHRSHYRPGYYGRRRYYGRRYGYYGYGFGNAIAGLVIFLIIFSFVIPAIPAAIVSTTDNYNFTLGPGQTRYVNHGTFDSGVDFQVTGGSADLLTFDNEPPLSNQITRTENVSEPLGVGDFTYFEFFLNKGSFTKVTWSSAVPLNYYVIEGRSDFDNWKKGESTEVSSDYGQSSVNSFTASKSESYFVAFENIGYDLTTFSALFDLTITTHDVNNPKQEFQGSHYLSDSDINADALIVYNSGSEDAEIIMTVHPLFSFGLTYLAFFALMVLGSIYIYRRSKNKSKERKENKMYPDASAPPQSSSIGVSSDSSAKASVDTSPTYVSRPDALFCGSCGSGVLPNAKFCTECGTAL